jgi:hypothetical protein
MKHAASLPRVISTPTYNISMWIDRERKKRKMTSVSLQIYFNDMSLSFDSKRIRQD